MSNQLRPNLMRFVNSLIILTCSVSIVVGDSVEPQQSAAQSKKFDQEIANWIKQLQTSNFAEREQATRELIKADGRGIDQIVGAAKSKSSEAGWRAVAVLLRLTKSQEPDTQIDAVLALEDIAADKRPVIADRAKKAQGSRKQVEAEFVKVLKQLGADVSAQGDEYRAINLTAKWKGESSHLARMRLFKSITRVYLNESGIAGSELKYLQPLSQLTYLSLKNLKIKDDDLKQISMMTNLESLGLDDTAIGDSGLLHLQRLKNIQTLWLNRTQVTDDGLVHLKTFTNLRKLDLSGTTGIDGSGLVHLKELPDFKFLSMQHVRISDDALTHIIPLHHLQSLGLDDTLITDAGIKQLIKMPNLRSLWLSNTAITDKSVEHLKQMTKLTTLFVSGTKLTPGGLSMIREALPNCRVFN